jgi:uncharacterized membrane protein YdjX (TVP38/TMEM64 family)
MLPPIPFLPPRPRFHPLSGDFVRVVSLTVAIYQFAFAFGPGLLGWLVSLGGSYVGSLWLYLGLQLLGAILVVQRPLERATLD